MGVQQMMGLLKAGLTRYEEENQSAITRH